MTPDHEEIFWKKIQPWIFRLIIFGGGLYALQFTSEYQGKQNMIFVFLGM
jgi:hypothetical protein